MLKRNLFKLARSPLAGLFIGKAFEYLSPLIPVDKLFEDRKLIVFHHPVKSWEIHLLIVPKKAIRGISYIDLSLEQYRSLLIEVLCAAQNTIRTLNLDKFTIFVNGGSYQDVPQVHFHIAATETLGGDLPFGEKYSPPNLLKLIEETKYLYIYPAHTTTKKLHILIAPKENLPDFLSLDMHNSVVREVLLNIFEMMQSLSKDLPAYTMLINSEGVHSVMPLSFHLISDFVD